MNGDNTNRPARGAQVVKRPVVQPGPLRELKALVYELYLQAGTPSLNTIATWIANDDELPGAPKRDTIYRIIGDLGVPPSQSDVVSVVSVLARAARWDSADATSRARDLWVAARLDSALGVPINEVTNPFDCRVRVHRPIRLDQPHELQALPPYVPRHHDELLAQVVARAINGESTMAVLIAGSSAGKTRACWEALKPLREERGWWFWHPYDPTCADAAREGLDRVGPRTVVWLDETQEYFSGDRAETVAAKLNTLLADLSRAPVLVLGTLWPQHHDALSRHSSSQVRHVLEGTVIEVPETVTGHDLIAMEKAAALDARLAWAIRQAHDGEITQCLAGGPEQLKRYQTAKPEAKALVETAIDARRMGHRNILPLSLLEHAAQAYLTDTQWDQLGEDWLEPTLDYLSRPCKGALGPLTRIRPRHNRPRRGQGTQVPVDSEPMYQLADYLDQYGRTSRVTFVPPVGFWVAAAHAHPDALVILAGAAWARGLYRDAAQLYKRATAYGDPVAASALLYCMHAVHPHDSRPARWVEKHVVLDDPAAVRELLKALHSIGAAQQFHALAEHATTHVDLDDPKAVRLLLEQLHRLGANDQVRLLMDRDPAAHVAFDNPTAVMMLLQSLHKVGATDQVDVLTSRAAVHLAMNSNTVQAFLQTLRSVGNNDYVIRMASRAAAHNPLNDPTALIDLLRELHDLGAVQQFSELANRAVTQVDCGDPATVSGLLRELRRREANGQISAFLVRNPATQVTLDDFNAARGVLTLLHEIRANSQLYVLAGRIASHLPLEYAVNVALILEDLYKVGAINAVNVLLARDPATQVTMHDPYAVTILLEVLHRVKGAGQIDILADRATAQVALDDPDAVKALLQALRTLVSMESANDLAGRAVAEVSLDDLAAVRGLMQTLHSVNATDQLNVLADRAVTHVSLEKLHVVAWLLEDLHETGAKGYVVRLADHAVAHLALDQPNGLWPLLAALQTVGATDQINTLLARNPAAHVCIEDPKAVRWLIVALQTVGATDQINVLLARDPAMHVCLDDPEAVTWLLEELHRLGHVDQAGTLAERAATHVFLNGPDDARKLLEGLHGLGHVDQAGTLAERAATDVALDCPTHVNRLLKALHTVGATDQAIVLAHRAATHLPLDDPTAVTGLLRVLHTIGARDQIAALLTREPAKHVTLDDRTADHPTGITTLLQELHTVGAIDQAIALADRLPSIGRFDLFTTISDHKVRFRYGREPSTTVATPWDWEGLE